jgi:nicotinate-nucleotide adenylyltransferase
MYGGAFDPPHNAHIAIARVAVAQLGLDELRVFPTGHAWHRNHALTQSDMRLDMARLAFDGVPRVTVDDREVQRAGPTYTIDTLRELQREFGAPELFLVMGADQAKAFTGWRDWADIARIAALCVAMRGASELPVVPSARFVKLELPRMPESATAIRGRAARGEDISALVPPPVARYIASHHLYQGH